MEILGKTRFPAEVCRQREFDLSRRQTELTMTLGGGDQPSWEIRTDELCMSGSFHYYIWWNILNIASLKKLPRHEQNGELTFSINSWLVVSRLLVYYVRPLSLILHHVGHTLDGRNPAPPRMFKAL